jgi:hypothetical protein
MDAKFKNELIHFINLIQAGSFPMKDVIFHSTLFFYMSSLISFQFFISFTVVVGPVSDIGEQP